MSKTVESFSADDAAIRQAFALASPHLPQLDIASAALALANKRHVAALQRTHALQRINRLWRAAALVAMLVIVSIIAFAMFWSFTTTWQNTYTASNSATDTATASTNASFTTGALEWILLMASLAIVWLIITSVMRAVSTETYEGLLA